MRASQVVLSAIGVLLATTWAAQPAMGQERTAVVRASVEDRHEARRRAAAERREAVLEWHRARRAGLDPRTAAADAPLPSLPWQVAGDAAALPAAAVRAPLAGREAVEAGPARPAVRPAVAERPGVVRAGVADAGEQATLFAAAQRRPGGEGLLARATAAPATWGRGWPDSWWEHEAWWEPDAWWWEQGAWWRNAPWRMPYQAWDAWRGPFGYRDLLCVGRVRDGHPAGSRSFDRRHGGRGWKGDRFDGAVWFRARCQPAVPFPHGPALPHAFLPGFWDPFAFAPYGLVPWVGRPVPHRFEHRFRQQAGWAPDEAAGWFTAGREADLRR